MCLQSMHTYLTNTMTKYPNFDSLPKVEGQPQGSAWGLWGQGDELGCE